MTSRIKSGKMETRIKIGFSKMRRNEMFFKILVEIQNGQIVFVLQQNSTLTHGQKFLALNLHLGLGYCPETSLSLISYIPIRVQVQPKRESPSTDVTDSS